MLGAPWNVPCLVVNGDESFSPLFIFPPNKFYFNFFIIDFKVLNHYFMSFLPFPWPLNCNHAFQCTKFSTHSSPNWFWLKIFSLSLNSWRCAWPHFTSLKSHKWMKNCPRIVLRFDIGPNTLVMKISNRERCTLVLKLNPLELGVIIILWTFVPWWFCYRSTPLIVMNLKLSMKFFMKLETPSSLYGLQFPTLDTIISCIVRFVDYLLIVKQIV
jgi:hypothetical protein